MTRGAGKHSQFHDMLVALVLAIVAGLCLRFLCGAEVRNGVSQWVLTPLKTVYLNALKLVVAPVVFCSIGGSIAGISDYKAYGRIGLKVVGIYLLTSLVASCVGVGVVAMFHPGAGVELAGEAHYQAANTEISLMDTLVNIVPTNLVSPFQESNMTQVIFLAILIGGAAGVLEQKSGINQVRRALELLHKLFLTIASMVLRFIPLGTFCAVALLILEIQSELLGGLIRLIGCVFLGAGVMMLFYGTMFALRTRQSPFQLLKKCLPSLTSFALLCSTSAVLPQTMDTCTERLGIHKDIASFAIPLGSTINMDGACIYLTVSALFLAEMYGVKLSPDMLGGLILTTLLLSVGAPPLPGAGFICLSVLVMQLGLPMDSIGYLLGIDQLMSMCRTVVNGAGDLVCAAVVAYGEGKMDLSLFRRQD